MNRLALTIIAGLFAALAIMGIVLAFTTSRPQQQPPQQPAAVFKPKPPPPAPPPQPPVTSNLPSQQHTILRTACGEEVYIQFQHSSQQIHNPYTCGIENFVITGKVTLEVGVCKNGLTVGPCGGGQYPAAMELWPIGPGDEKKLNTVYLRKIMWGGEPATVSFVTRR